MNFITKLLIDNKEIDVISYRFGFRKNIDWANKPITLVSFKGLEIEIESTESTYFEEWMVSQKSKERVKLQIFYPYLNGGSKIMTFYDCYLVVFQTVFSNSDTEPMKDRIQITCAGIKTPYSEIEYTTAWRKTFSIKEKYEQNSIIVGDNQNKIPKLLDYFFEDSIGNKLDKKDLQPNQNIVLVIQTEYADNETLDLDLNNNNLDFLYNNLEAENDKIKNIKIRGNETRVKLTTVKENISDEENTK